MGPSNHPAEARDAQAKRCSRRTRLRRPRPRLCLLKSCEQSFRAVIPQQRYCNAACRLAAARWRRWRTQKKYRTTEKGKQQRKAQPRRRWERIRDRRKCVFRPKRTAIPLHSGHLFRRIPDRSERSDAGVVSLGCTFRPVICQDPVVAPGRAVGGRNGRRP